MATYVGDIGKKIILETGQDLSAATILRIKYKKPNGTNGYWSATIESNVSNVLANMFYITVAATDLDQAGKWQLQAYAATPAWTLSGKTVAMKIDEAL